MEAEALSLSARTLSLREAVSSRPASREKKNGVITRRVFPVSDSRTLDRDLLTSRVMDSWK